MKVSLNEISEADFSNLQIPWLYLKVRRFFEIIFILLLLPVILVISLITMVVIKFESGSPIFFKQDRPGKEGSIIKLIKFRTMICDKHDTKDNIANERNKVTKIGKFLRKHSLDEIPQFFHVLKGEMSIIGPRPEPMVYYKECVSNIPFYNYRYKISPGLTGWAQVYYKHTLSIEDARNKSEYDYFYLFNLSPKLDFLIVIKTILLMFKGR